MNRFDPFGMKNTEEKVLKVSLVELKELIIVRKLSAEMSK